jgi:2'-5' RNA ligase
LQPLRTALVLVLDDARPALEPVRAEFHAESVARGIPLHVTVLFPFVAPDAVPVRTLEALFASFPPLDLSLTRLAEFPGVVYAVPEPDTELLTLMHAVHARFPETPPYEGEFEEVIPHATLSEGAPLDAVAGRCESLLPIACHVHEVTLLMESAPDRWAEGRRFALRGGQDARPYASPMTPEAYKLVWFVPEDALGATRDAVFAAGAGRIGDYERCSWYASGIGTFQGGEGTDPMIGEAGREEHVPELRVETVVPAERAQDVVDALVAAHPYEEVAFDLYPLANLKPK